METSAEQLLSRIRSSLDMLHDVGGAEFVSMIVQMFLDETPQQLRIIRDELSAGNTSAAAAVAHKLVGAARQFGLDSPEVPFEELELTARAEDQPRALELVSTCEAAFGQAEPLLRRYLLPG